jgi:hypothetical protein
MTKGHSYFVLLEELKLPGCPICSLVIKDGQSYLDQLLYENVLDVPTRLNLMDSFGFCNRHAWQIPKLPPICSPAVGFSIFASDLLRKFNLLVEGMTQAARKKSIWRSLFHGEPKRLFPQMKARVCPVCSHVAELETFHVMDLLDSITERELLEAYNASQGICLPHFFLIEENHASHPNFPLLLKLQRDKSQSLRERLEEFIRKQDRRFQDEITADEARVWRVALEFLSGKPGVFNNEMRTDLPQNGRVDGIPLDETVKGAPWFDRVTVKDLVAQLRTAKQVTIYHKQPLPRHLLKTLRDFVSAEMHPKVEIIAEDLADVVYLRGLHSSGFELFYGVGLPRNTLIFMDSGRGFVLENNMETTGFRKLTSKNAENLYYRLLWCRFGHAVLLSGFVKETDVEENLVCLIVEGKDVWCRLKSPTTTEIPNVGVWVHVFCWEKWATHILDVIQLEFMIGQDPVFG